MSKNKYVEAKPCVISLCRGVDYVNFRYCQIGIEHHHGVAKWINFDSARSPRMRVFSGPTARTRSSQERSHYECFEATGERDANRRAVTPEKIEIQYPGTGL